MSGQNNISLKQLVQSMDGLSTQQAQGPLLPTKICSLVNQYEGPVVLSEFSVGQPKRDFELWLLKALEAFSTGRECKYSVTGLTNDTWLVPSFGFKPETFLSLADCSREVLVLLDEKIAVAVLEEEYEWLLVRVDL